MNSTAILMILAALCIGGMAAAADDNEKLIVPLDGAALPDTIVRHNVAVEQLKAGPQRGVKVHFEVTDWPNVYFRPVSGSWDWSGYTGLAVDVYNPEPEAQNVEMRVDNEGADGVKNCNQVRTSVKAGAWTTFRCRFNRGGDKTLWGMRGLPITGPTGGGPVLDLKHIVAFQVFLAKPTHEHTLILNNIRLYGGGVNTEEKVKFPFVDRFGQYKNADWPGKLKAELDLTSRANKEREAAKAMPQIADRDRFGGWTAGPKLKATGWFRTEKVDGRWWLVTPEGRPFFSTGIDCIGMGEYTFIDGRDNWFEWLPKPGDREAQFVQLQQGSHSMADAIGGKGRTFSFYSANLERKYGADFKPRWGDMTIARMDEWGFNTIGNWSDPAFIGYSKKPFVLAGSVPASLRRIEGGGGYWGKMVDAYDPAFPAAVDESLGGPARQFASDPNCIGYFSDNEIAWEAVEKGPLASPPDQPCRVAEIEMLKQKYGNLEKLNAAWGVSAASWDALRAPDQPNAAGQKDLDAFVYQFAKRYFEQCKTAIKKAAPNQMYLGCRFASAPKPAVKACGDVADVVSVNIYRGSVNPADWTGANDPGKPVLIGEFHFGALDRGMFHEGLGPTANQAERAAAYLGYVRSVADCPNFVGCHWFQYIDEPITGRWFDGENYNIGLVDVTDTPYPELTEAARKANSEVYARHAASKVK